MLSPDEAATIILAHLPRLPVEDCPLLQAHGRVSRAPICADRPMPSFDRVTMDGYALRSAALAAGQRRFRVIRFQAAGMNPDTLESDDCCVEIATGAVLPSGADMVVPYEATNAGEARPTAKSAGVIVPYEVTIADELQPMAGFNVHREGSDHAAGSELVPEGSVLSGAELAVAAACGAAILRVAERPRVAVIATGDELVEPDAPVIAPHQTRRSNDYALRAALLRSGLVACAERFHLRDQPSEIETVLRGVLQEFDVLVLTGGISQGRLDFLPQVLADLGVEQKLRGVAQRPGKPLWFGMAPRQVPVFALPGNPVSAYTCLHRYVLPALAQMIGQTPAPEEWVVLSEGVNFRPALAYLLPVSVRSDSTGRRIAAPTPFNTSGDLGGLIGTHGFVELPAEQTDFPAGTVARFWRWI